MGIMARLPRLYFEPTFLVAIWRGGAPIGITVQEVLDYHVRSTGTWLVFPHQIQGLTREEILANKPVDESFFEACKPTG